MDYCLAPILPESIKGVAEPGHPLMDHIHTRPALSFYGGSDFRRLLRDIEDRYSGAFDELGPPGPSRTSSIS